MSSALATASIPGYLSGTRKADPAHSEVGFSGRHLLISNTRGRFTGYDVTIVTGEDPLVSSVTATIDLATVDTRLKMRDDHLRSPDYLDVEKYATMTYRSTGIRLADGGDSGDWVIDGELTLHGVTRPVPLALEVLGSAPTRGDSGLGSAPPRGSAGVTRHRLRRRRGHGRRSGRGQGVRHPGYRGCPQKLPPPNQREERRKRGDEGHSHA